MANISTRCSFIKKIPNLFNLQKQVSVKCIRPLVTSTPPPQNKPLTPAEPETAASRVVDAQYTELVRDFLSPFDFYKALSDIDVNFFCGVPDSLLKDFCAFVSTSVPESNHVITANEGSAIAMAAGYHLATDKPALVYLQNSGLGNIVNPLMSLASPSVYSIPMLLMIGWRGEPGKRDEPQHQVQGQVTPALLATLNIPFQVLPDYKEGAIQALKTAKQVMTTQKSPYCLLVKKQTFSPFKLADSTPKQFTLSREDAMKVVVDNMNQYDVVVSTTGMLSRELFEYREARQEGHEKDFLTVGSMGFASSIAMSISKFRTNRQIFCLDGDGATIMHMGNLATIGQHAPPNFKHILINNGKHDSVGGQPTDAGNQDQFKFCDIARGCGYRKAWTVSTPQEIADGMAALHQMEGPVLMEIKTNGGSRKDLGRPTRTKKKKVPTATLR